MFDFDCRDADFRASKPEEPEPLACYSDSEIADYGVRLMQGEPLDIVPPELRPFFARAQELARERFAALPPAAPSPPPVEVLRLTPHVWALLQSLAKAANLRRGEWPAWLAEAQAKDAAELAAQPEPAKPRPAHLRRIK